MRNNVLKFCAAAAMLFIPLPMISMLDVLDTERFQPFKYFLYFCFCWIPILLGYFLSLYRHRQTKPKKIFFCKLMLFGGAALLSIICAAVLKSTGELIGEKLFSFMSFLSLVLAVLMWYMLGMKLTKKNFDDVFTFPWLAVYITESFICCLFVTAQQTMLDNLDEEFTAALSSCRSLIVYQMIIMAMITVLLINQSNIETQINRRKNINLIVPRGLRSHNLRLILIVWALILTLMLCKDIITEFFSWIVQTSGKIVDALIMNVKMQTAPMMEDDGGLKPGKFFNTDNGGTDIMLYIVLVLAVVLIIVFRKKIAEFFRYMTNKLFKRLSVQDEQSYEDNGYMDHYERLNEQRQSIEHTDTSKLLKSYKKEKNATEKYRLGYRLYLIWLAKRSRKLSPSFTVEQQTDEALRIYNGECDIETISRHYSDIRYNGKSPANNEEIDRLVKELYK